MAWLVVCTGLLLAAPLAAKGGCNAKGKGPGCAPPDALSILPLYYDDFEASSKGWLPGVTSTLSGDGVLGGYCNFATGVLTRTYRLDPSHRGVRLRATVHLLDAWRGESVFLKVDGVNVWNVSHHHCPEIFSSLCDGINVAGDESFADTVGIPVEVFLPHGAATATVEFSTDLTGSACDASLAIDDVELSIY